MSGCSRCGHTLGLGLSILTFLFVDALEQAPTWVANILECPLQPYRHGLHECRSNAQI
jgi:hypothetical protein